MINRFLSWPIRTHLLILLVLLALPSVLLIVRSGIEERKEGIQEAQKGCLRLVDTMAAQQQTVVAGVEQLAAALALLPDVRTANRKATSTLSLTS